MARVGLTAQGRRVRSQREEEGLLDDLRALYRDVDARYAGTSCEGTTECCRFGRTGREPYVTELEVALIRKAIARRGGPKALARAASRPPAPLLPVIKNEKVCGLLTREGRCSIYAERPFGCRTFFCERATSLHPVAHREMLSFVDRLKSLAQGLGRRAHEGRPLSRILASIGTGSPG